MKRTARVERASRVIEVTDSVNIERTTYLDTPAKIKAFENLIGCRIEDIDADKDSWLIPSEDFTKIVNA